MAQSGPGLGDAPRVLIVEPNSEKAMDYSKWLKPHYEVDLVQDCASAYKLFQEEIDIALINRQLPDGSADELLSEIREFDLGWRVALLTDSPPPLDIVAVDSDEYLCHPITEPELCTTVNRLVAQARFGSVFTEFYSLLQKSQFLEVHYAASELRDNDTYTEIQSQLTACQKELADLIETFRTGGVQDGITPGIVNEY